MRLIDGKDLADTLLGVIFDRGHDSARYEEMLEIGAMTYMDLEYTHGFDDGLNYVHRMIENAPTIDKIYGYPVKDLLIFAIACRQQGITEGQLHDFVLNVQSAYDIINKEFENTMKECVGRMITNETN